MPGSTSATHFDWYQAPPPGVERVHSRADPLRNSVSWYVHRLPAHTDSVLDFSRDPVISLEVGAFGTIDRRVHDRWETAELRTDTLTLTPAMTPCEWRWNGQPFEILDVYIPCELMQSTWSEYFEGNRGTVNLSPELRFDDPSILFLMKSLLCGARQGHAKARIFYEVVTQHLIVAILSSAAAGVTNSVRAHGVLSARSLRRVTRYVDEYLSEDITLDSLAQVANVSRFHFLRKFKATVGQTPHRYLMHKRMDRACNLLLNSDLPVTQISGQCGFNDTSYFSDRFRQLFHLTPSEFRRAKS